MALKRQKCKKVGAKKNKCKAPKKVSVRKHTRSGYKVKGYCRG